MERLKGHGNGYAVWRVTHADGSVTTLKSWPLLFKSLLTLPVGMAQSQRQARGTRRLQELGLPTPAIVSGPKRVHSTVAGSAPGIRGMQRQQLLQSQIGMFPFCLGKPLDIGRWRRNWITKICTNK